MADEPYVRLAIGTMVVLNLTPSSNLNGAVCEVLGYERDEHYWLELPGGAIEKFPAWCCVETP